MTIAFTRVAPFEVWDRRPGSHWPPECVSRAATLAEAERSCPPNDGGRLLTIYDADGFIRGMFRDGKAVTDATVQS